MEPIGSHNHSRPMFLSYRKNHVFFDAMYEILTQHSLEILHASLMSVVKFVNRLYPCAAREGEI
jgi:hypothetical protein